MDYNVFYSWQSDLPNATNRGFIESCLKSAIKELKESDNFHVELNLDRDTKDELGTPDIVNTIFSKIERSKIFVADISIINSESSSRKTPNPNVLIELGFASKVLGWERVICLFNTDYGNYIDLPFDLKFRRPLTYSLKGKEKSKVKDNLKKVIKDTIQELYTKGMLNDELNDYLKMQVDTQIMSIINNLGKILCGYEGKKMQDKYDWLLNLGLEEIKEIIVKRKFLGFQVFKNFKNIEVELTNILKNITASNYYKREIGIAIVKIIKWINHFDKFNSLRQSPDLFVSTSEKTNEYNALFNQDLNPNNDEGYILIKILDDSKAQVVDFGEIQEKEKINLMLNYVYIKENYSELYSKLIYEFNQLIKKWLSLTNGEFIVDNLNHFEIKKETIQKKIERNISKPETLKHNALSEMDVAILDKLFNVFSGSIMHSFFEYLAETRSVLINQATIFDEEIKVFLSPHNRLRNKQLEEAKVQFFSDFENFLSFTTQFHTYNGGITARFKAKTDKEEEIYLGMVRNLYKKWSEFLEVVAKEAPNYIIKG